MLRNDRRQGRSAASSICSIFLITGIAMVVYFWLAAERVPKQVVLEADLEQGVIEYVPDDAAARCLLSKKLNLRDLVEALQRASGDDRVRGLVARVGQSPIRLAQVQEVRDAVMAFRSSGKPAIAYAETFGEAGPGNSSYYLATAFDAVYLQPSGDVGLTGLIFEQPFIRGALDKLDIIPRLDGRKEYKSFRYVMTERKYPPPHREAVMQVMGSQFSQMVAAIAERRKLAESRVRSLFDQGPFIGQDAVDAGLVDGLAYRDEVYAKIKDKIGSKTEFLSLTDYRERAGGPNEKGTTVALIYGSGVIARGRSGYNPATGELIMGADTVTSAFRAAVEDKDVKAILFRIDSPGGSYVASDTVWRETVNAKKSGKPVVVSMGAAAGSGGYFVALSADRIVAQPATITGSIGVFGGKMVTTGFWNKLGVTWDEVHTSRNSDAWTQVKDFTPEQRQLMGKWLDRIYADFTTKVSRGRNLPMATVEKIAKGRIWTGEDAKRLGLVDELGGFPVALRLVRRSLKLPDNARLKLKLYPEKKTLLGFISDLKMIFARDEPSIGFERTLEDLRPFVRTIHSLGLTSRDDVLRMPEFE